MSEIRINISYYKFVDGQMGDEHGDTVRVSLTKLVRAYIGDQAESTVHGPIDRYGNGNGTWFKWDSMDEDMLALSFLNPGTLFSVLVRDDNENKWKVWYQNGRKQECPLVEMFEPFNPEKLR